MSGLELWPTRLAAFCGVGVEGTGGTTAFTSVFLAATESFCWRRRVSSFCRSAVTNVYSPVISRSLWPAIFEASMALPPTSQAKARSMLFRSHLRTARNGWFRGRRCATAVAARRQRAVLPFAGLSNHGCCRHVWAGVPIRQPPSAVSDADCKSRTPYRSRELGHRARRSVSYNYVQLDRRVAKRGSELAWWAKSNQPYPTNCA